MIRLENDTLFFSFPDIHPQAQLAVDFQRTLRIPDDDRATPCLPGWGTSHYGTSTTSPRRFQGVGRSTAA